MSRMYDRVMLSKHVSAALKSQLDGAAVINGDECSRKFRDHIRDDGIIEQTIMNLAPPFSHPFWIEVRDRHNTEMFAYSVDHSWGYLFEPTDNGAHSPPEGARWRVAITSFREDRKGGDIVPISRASLDIRADGTPIDDEECESIIGHIRNKTVPLPDAVDTSRARDCQPDEIAKWERETISLIKSKEADEGESDATREAWRLMDEIAKHHQSIVRDIPKALGLRAVSNSFPAYFAISLMHCKNVELRPIDPPPALSKKHERKRGRPLVRYHELNIEPMKTVLRTEGRIGEVGLSKALHICRGHFKDFRERGLFGKYKGVYWWPQQLRGNANDGVVIKDYRVAEPPR